MVLLLQQNFVIFLMVKLVLQEVSNLLTLYSVTVDQLETVIARSNDICCMCSLIVGSSNARYTVEFVGLLAEVLDYGPRSFKPVMATIIICNTLAYESKYWEGQTTISRTL